MKEQLSQLEDRFKILTYMIPVGVVVLLGVFAILSLLSDGLAEKNKELPELSPIVIKEEVEVIKEVEKEVIREVPVEVIKEVKVGSNELLMGTVIRVIDGDTLEVRYDNGIIEKIRLWGIDAPERDQPYGVEASVFVNNAVGGNRVVVTQMEKDRYGRRIGAIGYPSERGISSLGVGLIRYGLAWHYKKYAPDNKQYSDDEKLAQKEKKGLWSGSNPIAPWDWRKGSR